MKAIAVIGLLSTAIMLSASNAYADDLGATMDVMDSSSSAVDELMNPIELSVQAMDKVQDHAGHGLDTANAAHASAADRIEADSLSEDTSDNASEAADRASDNASEAADAASDNASEAVDAASDNASEQASQDLASAGS